MIQNNLYKFTPAFFISNFVPLVIILDDGCNDEPIHFEYKMWNVLTLVVNSYDENTFLAHINTIKEIVQEYECENHVYIYANATKAYEALKYTFVCQAGTVYLDKVDKDLNFTQDIGSIIENTKSFPKVYLSVDDSSSSEYMMFDNLKKYSSDIYLDTLDKDLESEDRIQNILDMLAKMKY